MENIQGVFNNIRFQCRELGDVNNVKCQNMLHPLETLFKDISNDFDSVSHIISNSVSKRAAWFAGVGVVFKHIFGTMDENDAEHYNKAIQTLYNNEKIITDSLKKSVIVSQSAIVNINRTLQEININENKLSDAMDKISIVVKNLSLAVQVDNVQNAFNSALNILQSNLLTLSFKIEDILNSILFVKANILHPSVLTPNQLYKDIVNNLRVIPKYKDFPVNLEISNIHILLNIADLVCYYIDNKLVFVIKIPLVNVLEYNLYKSIPLPTSHIRADNSFVMIVPSEKYVALSKDKSSFTYLKNLNSCKNIIIIKTYLCEISDIYATAGNPSCEIEIITKSVTKLPETCQYKIIHGDVDIWHKLINEKWIFVQSKPAKLSIECNNNYITEFVVSGTGVLDIPLGCIAYHKNSRFIRNISPSINVPSILPDFNILNDSCCSINYIKNLTLPVLKIQNINLDDLKTVKLASDEIINDLNKVTTPYTWNNHISFPILSVLSCIVCLSFILFYFCKRDKCLQKLFPKTNKVTINEEENPNHSMEMQTPQPRLRIG